MVWCVCRCTLERRDTGSISTWTHYCEGVTSSEDARAPLAIDEHKRTLNRVAQQKCRQNTNSTSRVTPSSFRRARRKQKYVEMERQVELLQRELQSYEATKTEAEGLLLENNLLRRVSMQQISVIENLRKQLAALQGHNFFPYNPVLRRHSHPEPEFRPTGFPGFPVYENEAVLRQELFVQEDCYPLPKMPLPVPEFQPHTTAMKRTLCYLEDVPKWQELEKKEEAEPMHMDDQHSVINGVGEDAENEIFKESAFVELLESIPNTGEVHSPFNSTY